MEPTIDLLQSFWSITSGQVAEGHLTRFVVEIVVRLALSSLESCLYRARLTAL